MFTPNQNKFSNKGKILVAFYSQTGQTKKYAQIIAQKLEADIYEIIPVRKYNDDMWAAAAEAFKEIKENRYPALKGSLPDISSYNIIIEVLIMRKKIIKDEKYIIIILAKLFCFSVSLILFMG